MSSCTPYGSTFDLPIRIAGPTAAATYRLPMLVLSQPNASEDALLRGDSELRASAIKALMVRVTCRPLVSASGSERTWMREQEGKDH